MKVKKLVILLVFAVLTTFCVSGCDFTPESEEQSYYTPTAEQIQTKIFTLSGTKWGVSFYQRYTADKKKYSKKGSGSRYTFSSDLIYDYQDWKNDYEYIWAPYTTKSYTGVCEISDGKIIFHNLFGETVLEKNVQLSDNGEWLKIGNSAYKRNN